jgi:glutathione S-transferase
MTRLKLWGLIASPFQLKMQSLADQAGVHWERWPDQAGLFDAISTAARINRGRHNQSIDRIPQRIPDLDEYPAVPYYSFDGRNFFYDSTGLALHLDKLKASPSPLIPEQAELHFICQLIDEAFDEFGLYMVHHNRWVTSAATNRMGAVTSREMRKLVPPGGRQLFAGRLSQRQVRRCPYLFSVAPSGFDAGVPQKLTPPARQDFPPTHEILDTAWRRYLAAIERVLQHQPYLLGQRFTLADASAYGQLSMNLIDGKAAQLLQELAPLTFNWLCMIRDGGHKGSSGDLQLSEHLAPLLQVISETFIPLMQQNEAAHRRFYAQGQTRFNEAAFDRGEALYDGELLGKPFRHVAKNFQVPVWQTICQCWIALTEQEKGNLERNYTALKSADFAPRVT